MSALGFRTVLKNFSFTDKNIGFKEKKSKMVFNFSKNLKVFILPLIIILYTEIRFCVFEASVASFLKFF